MTANRGGVPLDPEEEWARSLVEWALGQTVVQHDDNSKEGMHDLTILYPDGIKGAVEVTQAADEESVELWRLLHGDDKLWTVSDLVGGWLVCLEPRAREKTIRKDLPGLLRRLEAANVTDLRVVDDLKPDPFYEDAAALGVHSAFQSGTSHAGSISCTIEQSSERSCGVIPPTSNAVAAWIGDFLINERPRHVEKLRRSGFTERHAFVIVPSFAAVPFEVADSLMRDEAPLPTDDPVLPKAVTHVWIVGIWRPGSGFRWSLDQGWQPFAKDDSQADSPT